VIVNKVLKANIGLEHFWQFTSQPVDGNSLLTFTPWSEPGRGLSTVVRLIYNSGCRAAKSRSGSGGSLVDVVQAVEDRPGDDLPVERARARHWSL
jgi:hypothetical protein